MADNDLAGRSQSGRARTLEAFFAMLALMKTRGGVEKGLGITLAPTDIVVAPFGKSGTTWLQQIAHSLRTRGDMDFDEIWREQITKQLDFEDYASMIETLR